MINSLTGGSMKKAAMMIVVSLSFALAAAPAAAVPVGKPAPDFTLSDASGKPVRLSELKGKYVVLEWVNPECPYVQKHYNSGNMPALQKEYAGANVVWLAVNSTNPRAGDYKSTAQMQAWMKEKSGAPSATLLDESGKVGRAYGARTTPHMYIIDPQGQTIYAGAIDDKPTTRTADVKTAKNFVRAAMGEALAGKPVTTASTTSYGCTVKY